MCLFKIEVAISKVVFPNEESDEDFIYGKLPTASEYDKKSQQQHDKPHHKFPIDETEISCSSNVTIAPRFCEEDESQAYPIDYIESLLKEKLGELKSNVESEEVMNRDNFLDEPDVISQCEVHRRKIYPRKAWNKELGWRYIINLPKYHQPIIVELCQKASGPCLFNDYLPFGVLSSCTQKYSKKQLYALDAHHGNFFESEYEYPSHCTCDYYRRSRL